MDEQIAKAVIVAGAAVGVVVWLFALQLYRKVADAPALEVLETPVSGKSPAEAIKSVVANAAHISGHAQLARPEEHVLEITQCGCHTRIAAERRGGQTTLTAEFDDSRLRRKLQRILALFVVLLMPVTIVGVAAALWHFAAPSASPSTRWQSVQVVQIVHVLWPPFAIYAGWKQQRTTARSSISNLLVLAEA